MTLPSLVAVPTTFAMSNEDQVARTIVSYTHADIYMQIQSQVLLLQTAIEHKFSSSYVHDDILRLPRRKHSSPSPATDIARLLFPDHSQIKADIQYEIALSHARRVVRQRKDLAAVRQRNLANDSISQVTQVGLM